MVDVTLKLDEQDFADMVRTLGLTEQRLYAAGYRAVRKTVMWVKTHLARTLSKELQIVQKLVRQRLRVYMQDRRAMQGKVWMGMYKIRASRLGRARQTRAGVSVGRHRFPGSFEATMPSGHTDVFKRRGKSRLKIDIQQLDISEQARQAIAEINAKADERLMIIMEQEINYEIHRMAGRAN
jgi:hypothetical protein